MADDDSRAGRRYDDKEILDYVQRVHIDHDNVLTDAFHAAKKNDMPAIMLGPSEGKWLQLCARLIAAERAVEIGALAGYSAIHLARGLAPAGRLWSVEENAAYAQVASNSVAQAGFADKVEVVVGAALDVLPTLETHAPFDLVFIDADKANYPHYGVWARKHLRPGGVLIGDNAFFFGDLLVEDNPGAAAMRSFHEDCAQHFDSVCLPTPDGMVVGIKR